MTWWNTFVDWLSSSQGSRIVTDAILPFIAILLAGVIAALIARGMSSRMLELREREVKAAAVTSLIGSARRAVDWSELGADEKAHATHLADEASVRLRLLPIAGSGMAASWAEHEIQAIKTNSSTFRFQAEQTFADVRDRLVEWQAKPARARKLFRPDLDRWKAEGDASVESADAAGAAPIVRGGVVTSSASSASSASASSSSSSSSAEVALPAVAPAAVAPAARALAPSSPSDAADTESRDTDDREPAYSSPVSAHDVRRRTAPDAAAAE